MRHDRYACLFLGRISIIFSGHVVNLVYFHRRLWDDAFLKVVGIIDYYYVLVYILTTRDLCMLSYGIRRGSRWLVSSFTFVYKSRGVFLFAE